MTLETAYKRGFPLMFVQGDMRRWIAALIVRDNGIAYADIGWNQLPSFHPFHAVFGRVEEVEDGWRVGDATIEIVTADPDADSWQGWLKLCGTKEPAIRAEAEKQLQTFFDQMSP